MKEADWLAWAREAQAIAQNGLSFADGPFDRERYTALQALAARVMAEAGGADLSVVQNLFAAETDYATPKIGVRGAAFDAGTRPSQAVADIDSLPGDHQCECSVEADDVGARGTLAG